MKKTILQLSIAFTLFLAGGKVQAQAQADGTLDISFNVGTGFNNAVSAIVLQPNGKVLVGGSFTSYNGQTQNRIVRLNEDGTIDTLFNIGTGLNNSVFAVALQPDGKILVGGSFTEYNGQTRNRIIRLNEDGSLDTFFNIGAGFSFINATYTSVRTISLQPDDKILVGGRFTQYDGQNVNYIVRLNTDGSLDTSFDVETGFNDVVFTITPQTDGKILVGGWFTSYNGQAQNKITRLNADGALDATFDIGTGFNDEEVSTIVLQSDGKILVGGYAFTLYNGQTSNRIVRLDTDGTLDTSFNIGTGFNNAVNTISLQSNGKILVGGDFTSYNGQTRNRIVRLNTDGSLDNSFNIGAGLDNWVTTIALQPNGKILVGGNFTEYDGITQNRIVRLNGTATAGIEDFDNVGIKIYPNPVKDILYFEKGVQKVTITDLTGKVLSTQSNSNQINMSAFQNGVYLITIEQENGVKETSKIIKQ